LDLEIAEEKGTLRWVSENGRREGGQGPSAEVFSKIQEKKTGKLREELLARTLIGEGRVCRWRH